MKTRCPSCQTSFRVTPEQLKVRAGKVRCGQCQSAFNALDSLIEDIPNPAAPVSATAAPFESENQSAVSQETDQPSYDQDTIDILLEPLEGDSPSEKQKSIAEAAPLSVEKAQALGKASGLILPRETTEIPGYSKWAEGVMTSPNTLPGEQSARWPFITAATLLFLLLAGQATFHFRSELAVMAPGLRPALLWFANTLDADIPLPRHAELLNIESSELIKDPANDKLLILQAILRNRAAYGQAYPALELTLTDIQDVALARRVFQPAEYLPTDTIPAAPFAPQGDVALRLWIDAREIEAAGYRVYVFYP